MEKYNLTSTGAISPAVEAYGKEHLEKLLGEPISVSEYEILSSLIDFDIKTIQSDEYLYVNPIKYNLIAIRDPLNVDDLAYIAPNVKVEWVNMDEGWCGDYNPDDPTDENLLRFDVYVLRALPDGEYWVEADDASYCTAFPASASLAEKVDALRILGKEFYDALAFDIDVSVKKLGERLSHISPEDLPSRRNIPLEDKLRGAAERAAAQGTPEQEGKSSKELDTSR